jgi:hypothetical protein
MGYEGMEWMQVVRDMVHLLTLVNTVMNLRFPEKE